MAPLLHCLVELPHILPRTAPVPSTQTITVFREVKVAELLLNLGHYMILLASNHFLAADIIEVVGESHGGAEIRHEILQINHPAFPIVVRPSGVAALPGRPCSQCWAPRG